MPSTFHAQYMRCMGWCTYSHEARTAKQLPGNVRFVVFFGAEKLVTRHTGQNEGMGSPRPRRCELIRYGIGSCLCCKLPPLQEMLGLQPPSHCQVLYHAHITSLTVIYMMPCSVGLLYSIYRALLLYVLFSCSIHARNADLERH